MTDHINPLLKTRAITTRGLDPFPWYKQMRSTEPVYYDAQHNAWQLFRYNDIQAILGNPTTFSSERGTVIEGRESSLLLTDPPRHRQLRNLVSQAFTPRIIEQMAEHIRSIVNQLLDTVADKDQMDIIQDLAYPLPVIVIAEMLGVPSQDREKFKHWSDQVVSHSIEEAKAATIELDNYFRQQIAHHQQDGQDDLLGRLITAHADNDSLTEADVVVFCTLLMVAGNETTTNLIGNALWCFDEYPDAWQHIHNDPSLIPSAVEEVLRFRSPVQRTARIAVTDAEISGKQITAGQAVFSWLGAANHDENQFPDPETFNIQRSPNRHLAFGYGIHFCLGAYLSRLESKIALECLTERYATINRIREVPLQPADSFFALGISRLPVTLQKNP